MSSSELETLLDLYENSKPLYPPAKDAVIFCDGRKYSEITYEDVESCATELAHFLPSAASRKVVACCGGPSILTPAIALGILKASAAFFFMDMQNSPTNSLLTQKKALSSEKRAVVASEASWSGVQSQDSSYHDQEASHNMSGKHTVLDQLWHVATYVPVEAVLMEGNYVEVLSLNLCSCWYTSKEICILSSTLKMFLLSQKCCNGHSEECNFHKWKSKCDENLAYVIQTSGSTGAPKTVQVPHSCIVPNITHLRSMYSLTSSDVIFLAAPLTFDPSVVDIFLALSVGASLVIVPNHIKKMPRIVERILLEKKVSVLQVTPSFLMSLNRSYLRNQLLGSSASLRILSLGGERCPSVPRLRAIMDQKCPTKMFNLYGLTEVSCWATCNEITFDELNDSSDVPLGLPLAETYIDVHDDDGQPVREGCGQLFVGGLKRFCIVDGESRSQSQKPRPTGDWVCKRKDGKMFFEGRKDSIIKYHGQKLSISAFDASLEQLDFIMNHTLLFKESVLYVFIVLSGKHSISKGEAKPLIRKAMGNSSSVLPVTEITFVPYIPVNRHGKVDHRKLLIYLKDRKRKHTLEEISSTEVLKMVSKIWRDHTSVNNISNSDNYILNGGNSISALQFVLEIEQWTGKLFPTLLDVLLNYTFIDVVNLVNESLKETGENCSVSKSKRIQNAASQVVLNKDQISDGSKKFDDRLCHIEATRRGYREFCFCGSCDFSNIVNTKFSKNTVPKFKWKHDLGKCIDASVCAVYFSKLDAIHFYIGSHSGRFACVSSAEGDVMWEISLPDRIESSACLSACGCFVLVGCYDHHLYCFDSIHGSIKWKMKAGAEIKSSPVVSGKNIAYVGSHDKHLFAVHVESGIIAWSKKISNGSIFSSPAVCSSFVCAASLDGVLATLDLDSGDIVWSYTYGKPFFSSPLITESSVFIGCVDGHVLQFDFLGNMVRRYSTDGPVFSSPVVSTVKKSDEDIESIVFGSHDSRLYCYLVNGELLWTHECDSPIYSTPFSFVGSGGTMYLVAGSTSGRLYVLSAEDGSEIFSHKCSGEIFSSAIASKYYIAVGCRDNYIYIFEL